MDTQSRKLKGNKQGQLKKIIYFGLSVTFCPDKSEIELGSKKEINSFNNQYKINGSK